jgi:hypothetical protein
VSSHVLVKVELPIAVIIMFQWTGARAGTMPTPGSGREAVIGRGRGENGDAAAAVLDVDCRDHRGHHTEACEDDHRGTVAVAECLSQTASSLDPTEYRDQRGHDGPTQP